MCVGTAGQQQTLPKGSPSHPRASFTPQEEASSSGLPPQPFLLPVTVLTHLQDLHIPSSVSTFCVSRVHCSPANPTQHHPLDGHSCLLVDLPMAFWFLSYTTARMVFLTDYVMLLFQSFEKPSTKPQLPALAEEALQKVGLPPPQPWQCTHEHSRAHAHTCTYMCTQPYPAA